MVSRLIVFAFVFGCGGANTNEHSPTPRSAPPRETASAITIPPAPPPPREVTRSGVVYTLPHDASQTPGNESMWILPSPRALVFFPQAGESGCIGLPQSDVDLARHVEATMTTLINVERISRARVGALDVVRIEGTTKAPLGQGYSKTTAVLGCSRRATVLFIVAASEPADAAKLVDTLILSATIPE